MCGVPQGTIPGPVLFSFNMFGNITSFVKDNPL